MDETRSPDVARLIQAQRFELVDDEGRVRAVLGDVKHPEGYAPGLQLRDVDGRTRTWYELSRFGPALYFDVGGNDVLGIGVNEDDGMSNRHPEFDPTAYIMLADGDGDHRWSVYVHHDGTVEVLFADGDQEVGDPDEDPRK